MARTDSLTNFLTDVAAAIKTKKGSTDAIAASAFDSEILNLPSSDSSALLSLITKSATQFEIPFGAEKIGAYAFYNCSALTAVTIPQSVTEIELAAFSGCQALESISIPNSVTYIGGMAFSNCKALTQITVPASVIHLGGNQIFVNCTSLEKVTVLGNITLLGGSNTFSNCTDLKELDLSNCTAVPTLGNVNVFNKCHDELQIKVPAALLDEWKAKTNWATFADKIVGV